MNVCSVWSPSREERAVSVCSAAPSDKSARLAVAASGENTNLSCRPASARCSRHPTWFTRSANSTAGARLPARVELAVVGFLVVVSGVAPASQLATR